MRRLSLAVILPLVILVAAAIRGAVETGLRSPPSAVPRAVVLDVGQGDAILLDGPGDDAEVLIDGGPDARRLIEALREELGGDRTVNLVVLTHPHADHLVGLLPVLERYEVARVLVSGVAHDTRTHERFLAAIAEHHVPMERALLGQTYDIGPFHLDVLAPIVEFSGQRIENLNDASVVMALEVRTGARFARMLLTGDAEATVETAMLDRLCPERAADAPCAPLRADVLKVPHHGSEDSSSESFLQAVAPTHAIISAGVGNSYGHPNPRALKRLERTGATIWRTDTQGNITVTFDEDLSVTAER